MTEAYVAHMIIRKLAHWGVWAFFARFQVINGENMPDVGPVIMWVPFDDSPSTTNSHNIQSTATHHNMMLDPAVLCTFS
jgi:glycerol-3-phosphate O-acyltransferase / dihydroxyacetone phosphate acyltransferase